MDKRPLAVIAIFFIAGIILARFLPDSIKFLHIFIITLVLIPLTLILSPKGRGRIANIFLLLSITSFAALLYINSSIFPKNHISHFLGEKKLKTSIVGIIRSPALTRKPYFGKINSTYIFEVEAIKDSGEWWKVNGLSQIRIQTEKDYGYGDRLLVRGTMRRPGLDVGAESYSARMSGGLRIRPYYREYLERQNIFALINTREHNVTILSHNYKSNPILRYIYLVRAKLKNQIIKKMPLESGAFLSAILLGDRSELPKHLQTAFKNCGVYHILPTKSRKKYNATLSAIATC